MTIFRGPRNDTQSAPRGEPVFRPDAAPLARRHLVRALSDRLDPGTHAGGRNPVDGNQEVLEADVVSTFVPLADQTDVQLLDVADCRLSRPTALLHAFEDLRHVPVLEEQAVDLAHLRRTRLAEVAVVHRRIEVQVLVREFERLLDRTPLALQHPVKRCHEVLDGSDKHRVNLALSAEVHGTMWHSKTSFILADVEVQTGHLSVRVDRAQAQRVHHVLDLFGHLVTELHDSAMQSETVEDKRRALFHAFAHVVGVSFRQHDRQVTTRVDEHARVVSDQGKQGVSPRNKRRTAHSMGAPL